MTAHDQAPILVFYDKPEEFMPDLKRRFPSFEFALCRTYGELPHALAEVRPQIMLGYKFEPKPYPRKEILASPELKWLSLAFAGVDHLVPWDDSRLTVTNAAGVASIEMAHYALAAIFGMYQGFSGFFADQAARKWNYHLIRSSRNATIGLVGLGHAGREIARMAKACGLGVVTCRMRPGQEPAGVDKVYPFDLLHEMLGTVDVVVVCAALTPITRDLFGQAAFAAMRRGSYFVSMSRGALVQEDALISALSTGQLAGAVIDVARNEPLSTESPLWSAPNLFITPHTCSEYEGWFRDAALMFADNLDRWNRGEPLENRVYSDRGY